MSRPFFRLCLLIVVAAVVPACGGGGSGVGTVAPVIFNKARGFDNAVQSIAPATDGSIDGTFVSGTGFNNFVQSIAPAIDGSGNVYVGGSFGVYNSGVVDYIVRLNRNGLAD